MRHIAAIVAIILPIECAAQASVDDLLKASRARKGPGVSFAEGFTQGFQHGYDDAPYKINQELEIRRQEEELRQRQAKAALEREILQNEQSPQPTDTPPVDIKSNTVEGLKEHCRRPGDLYCIGFLEGAIAMMQFVSLDDIRHMRRTICLPESPTYAQLQSVFVLWADKNPSGWHRHAAIPMAEAFNEAFPCPKKQTKKVSQKKSETAGVGPWTKYQQPAESSERKRSE